MNAKSLHLGYPRSPFKLSAFINALLFFMPHLGFEVVPVRRCPLASELQRRTACEISFVAEHQCRTISELQSRTVSELQRRNVSELQRRTMSKLQRRTVSGLQRRTISEVSYHLGSKSRRSLAELNVGNALYGASHSRLNFMPDYF